jgi:uncharacterized protein YjbJ (UPF0337 family)
MDKDRIAGSAKDFAGKVESTVGDLAGDAKTQAEGRAREAAGTVQNLYGQAKDAARDATDAAVNYAKDAYDNSGDTVRSGQQAVAKTVQDNPLGALLVAGGIGFALALLMTRPPRRPPPRWRYYVRARSVVNRAPGDAINASPGNARLRHGVRIA